MHVLELPFHFITSMCDLQNFALLLLTATAVGAESNLENSNGMELHASGTVLPYVLKSPSARDTKRYTLLSTNNDASMALDKEPAPLDVEDIRESNSQIKTANLWDRIALFTTLQPSEERMPFSGNNAWYHHNAPTCACNPHCRSITLPFALLMVLNFGFISYLVALGSQLRLSTFAPALNDYGYSSAYNGHSDKAWNSEQH